MSCSESQGLCFVSGHEFGTNRLLEGDGLQAVPFEDSAGASGYLLQSLGSPHQGGGNTRHLQLGASRIAGVDGFITPGMTTAAYPVYSPGAKMVCLNQGRPGSPSGASRSSSTARREAFSAVGFPFGRELLAALAAASP